MSSSNKLFSKKDCYGMTLAVEFIGEFLEFLPDTMSPMFCVSITHDKNFKDKSDFELQVDVAATPLSKSQARNFLEAMQSFGVIDCNDRAAATAWLNEFPK
jgi:hypothetical protein